MSRFNTGNPINSLAEEDFYDNCLSLDQAMNSTEPTWRDRFNVEKPTIDAALKSAGFMPAGFDFVTGGTLQPGDRNKAVYNPAPNGDNNWYRWNGVFPKEIAANSQPNPKDENNWVLAHFRIGIAEKEALRRTYLEAGYNLVEGSFEQGGVLVNSNDVLLQERTGKVFSGPAGTYSGGISPSTFTDRSKSVFGTGTVDMLTAGLYGVGAIIELSDRDFAKFEVVSGGTPNGFDIINAGGGNTAVLSKDQKIYAEHLGVIAGSFSSENKVAVVKAIKYSSDHRVPVYFKNARYPAWNYIIDVPGAEVVGAGRPNYASDLSGLVDGTGTIFDGRVMFRGDDLSLFGFGADAGLSSTTALVQDAIVVIGNKGSTVAASVINHKYDELIGLVAASDSPHHGILLQGINHLEFGTLVSVNGLFGTVIKCQNVIGKKLIGINQGNTSTYIKGDLGTIAGNTYGVVENVSIDEINYTGSGVNNVVSACKIHGNSAKVSNVNVGIVKSTGGGVALHVQSSGGTTQVVGVDIGSVQGHLNYQELIVDAINPDGIYGVNIGQITTYNPRRGVIVEAKTDHSLNVHVGSIVGTNTGTKDIPDLDVVLKGGFYVDCISVSSSNARPTVAITSMRLQKVSKSNILLDYEKPLTLLNGHVNFDQVNVFRLVHNGDGFGFAGRITPLSATDSLIFNLPATLSCKPKLIPVPYTATDFSFKTAFIYIDGVTVSLVSPADNTTIRWMDMSSIFVNFKSYLK